MNLRTRLLIAIAALTFLLSEAQAANWQQPVAALARQIAALAGPGPVQLIVRNRSSLSPDEIPAIRLLLQHDLRTYGIVTDGSDSPTLIRVTLSENLRGGLWVAEVQEGTETRMTMLPVTLDDARPASGGRSLTLQRTIIITEPDLVLDAQVVSSGGGQRLVVLEPRQILIYATNPASSTPAATTTPWTLEQTFGLADDHAFPRDPRGRIVAGQGDLFNAYLPGMLCSGTDNGPRMSVACGDSDDPWPVTSSQRAFYDSARDYFMGVLVPGFGMQLLPFYDAAEIPRPVGSATLLNNVDGTATMVENDSIEPVNGTNDWGSDLAAIHSACGSGTQVLVSGSGSAEAGDRLRAYEITGREAIPVSAPLQVPGVVTAIWPTIGGNAMVVVHQPGSGGYEVWSVAASCN